MIRIVLTTILLIGSATIPDRAGADRGYFSHLGAGPDHRAGAFYGNGPDRQPGSGFRTQRSREHNGYHLGAGAVKPFHYHRQRERRAYIDDFNIRRPYHSADSSSSKPRRAPYNPNYLGRNLHHGD